MRYTLAVMYEGDTHPMTVLTGATKNELLREVQDRLDDNEIHDQVESWTIFPQGAES